MEQLMAQFTNKGGMEEEVVNALEGTPFESMAKALLEWQRTWNKGNGQLMFARMPFEIEIK